MQITKHVHLLRKEFQVTPIVRRYVNIYLIIGKEGCYLVDAGVAGTEELIAEYLEGIEKKMSDIKGLFLTHSHPDHIGAAAEIKRQSGCKVYAPFLEKDWIENIEKQYEERPIPNFFRLLIKPVQIDCELHGGERLMPEDGLTLHALQTSGHSHGSISYVLNDEIIFMGDAIPALNDLPIFTDYEQSMQTLDRIKSLPGIKLFCPAWDKVYDREEMEVVIEGSREMLTDLRRETINVYQQFQEKTNEEKILEVLARVGLIQYAGNPLVAKSITCIRDASFVTTSVPLSRL